MATIALFRRTGVGAVLWLALQLTTVDDFTLRPLSLGNVAAFEVLVVTCWALVPFIGSAFRDPRISVGAWCRPLFMSRPVDVQQGSGAERPSPEELRALLEDLEGSVATNQEHDEFPPGWRAHYDRARSMLTRGLRGQWLGTEELTSAILDHTEISAHRVQIFGVDRHRALRTRLIDAYMRLAGGPRTLDPMSPLVNLVPEQMRQARERAGLSQAEVAQAIGVHKSTLCRWETGEMLPNLEHLTAWGTFMRSRITLTIGLEEVRDEEPRSAL